MTRSAVVVGAGIFGVTAAIDLADRGWTVQLVDRGPIPHPSAASTDISKAVRADYGADSAYTELMVSCLDGWTQWNDAWDDVLFHRTGMLFLAGGSLDDGGFEADCHRTVGDAGLATERLSADDIARRFPAFRAPGDASLSLTGGFAESGRVVERLVADARARGVTVTHTEVTSLAVDGDRVAGVETTAGTMRADVTVAAAGAWTATLVPGLDDFLRTTGQPVVHLAPADPEPFRPDRFPTWAADIARTGWYGFPLHAGVVKVANHGAGIAVAPDAPRTVEAAWIERCRAFLADWIPSLADAPVASTRLCLYTDTPDGDLLIDRHPDLDGLVVATGGSGHAFKFAPRLGGVIADAVEGRDPGGIADRFRWRSTSAGREAARAR